MSLLCIYPGAGECSGPACEDCPRYRPPEDEDAENRRIDAAYDKLEEEHGNT